MKTKIDRATAKRLAEEVVRDLADACDRIEIAGSIRRAAPVIGDLEIIAIAKPGRDLFGESATAPTELSVRVDELLAAGRFSDRPRNGPNFKQLVLPWWIPATGSKQAPPTATKQAAQVDLFITSAKQWAVQLAIRTGPADYSKRLVTRQSWGGLLREGLTVSSGRVWESGKALDLVDEQDFFERCIVGGFVPPASRYN